MKKFFFNELRNHERLPTKDQALLGQMKTWKEAMGTRHNKMKRLTFRLEERLAEGERLEMSIRDKRKGPGFGL